MYTYFAYECAESVLDEYALNVKRGKGFIRAYKMFKWHLAGIACMDFSQSKEYSEQECMSFAWEDAEVAFRGYGEPAITGHIIGLWNTVPVKEYNAFERITLKAFKQAEMNTEGTVQRRYMVQWRSGPIRRPEQGFTLPTVDPTYGPRRHDLSNPLDSDVFLDVEKAKKAEQSIILQPTNTLPEKNGPGPQLRILK